MTSARTKERHKRRRLFELLRLQSEILCESHSDEEKQRAVLSRMMQIMLSLQGEKLNAETREALANHLTDCPYDWGNPPDVELGGPYERDMLSVMGVFNIGDLAKRIVWTGDRLGGVVEGRASRIG